MKAPTIIIGVGGVGSQICAKVEKQLCRMADQSGDSDCAKNTRFIAIDTDINSLRELHRHGFRGKRILLTDNMTVAKCRDTIGDPSIDRWYPENTIFSRKSMTEGAGQQRSISRLAFEYCLRDGRLDQLDNTVRELNPITKEVNHQRTRFCIISSLAGGTGSGIILPLAMYINNSILRMYQDNLAICKGFFILSSAFYAQNRMTALERKSLDANAYAAVKELSAFMRAEDSGGAWTREELSYQLGNTELRSKASYEYCYLFGLTNEKNRGICSFEELKEVVADAVYMQACSPMQDRNNSREDNTLRHIGMLGETKHENWLRRFGGIGCGRLIYPYEALVRYFGLRWAKDTMGRTWRQYDEEYFKSRKNVKNRQLGIQGAAGPDQGEMYIRAVDSAGSLDLLANHIRKECAGQGRDKTRWDLYLDALKAETQREIELLWKQYKQNNIWNNFYTKRQNITVQTSSRKANVTRYENAEWGGDIWDQIWDEMAERLDFTCDCVCNSLFCLHAWDPTQGRDALRDCWLEYWLISETGQFLHPNSLRYFLYHLRNAIARKKPSPAVMAKPSPPFQPQKKKKMSLSEGKKLEKEFAKQQEELKVSMAEILWERTLNRCESYVKKMIDCYEDFYSSYDMILEEFDTDISTIEKELDRKEGVIRSYVCADKICREKLHDKLSCQRSYDVGAVSGMSYELFRLVHESGLTSGRMATRECANRIKEFWCAGIERRSLGGDLLDMNILHAMSMEAECKNGAALTEEDFEEEIGLVENSLAAPFLQFFRRLDMNIGISLCCYHSSLKEDIGTFRNMVRWLDDHGAVDDPDYCTGRELLFYRSFVGLEPYEVLDYLHGISARTAVKGPAFCSYQEMLGDISKNGKNAGKVMTPHADVKWHNLYYMEDPSESYQWEQEQLITIALLYACLNGAVEENDGEKKYSFSPLDTNSDAIRFDRLADFHIILYGSFSLYMDLYRKMYHSILNALSEKTEPYAAISKGLNNRSPFDLIVLYQYELLPGHRTWKQCQQLANAGVCLIYACTEKHLDHSKEAECTKRAIELLEQTRKTVESGRITGFKNKIIDLDNKFQSQLEDFINNFIYALKEMDENTIRERYGTVLRDYFSDLPREL